MDCTKCDILNYPPPWWSSG